MGNAVSILQLFHNNVFIITFLSWQIEQRHHDSLSLCSNPLCYVDLSVVSLKCHFLSTMFVQVCDPCMIIAAVYPRCLQGYIDALQTQWSWLLQLDSCTEMHLQKNAEYFQVCRQPSLPLLEQVTCG